MQRLARALAAIALCTPLAAPIAASAQDGYPNKPIRLIVPFPAGGGTDAIGRLVGDRLAQRLKQPVVVENRAGAGGAIGTEAAARAAPDGYTLLIGSSGTIVMLPNLHKVPYDPVNDLAPIAQITQGGLLLVAHPQAGIENMGDVLRQARDKPSGLTYASGGIGTGGHIIGESIKFLTQANLVHVPYKGGAPSIADTIAGHVPLLIGETQGTLAHVNGGRLKAVAVAGPERSACLPNVPTLKEQGVAFELTYWWGLLAPARTPRPIVDMLNREVNDILRQPDVLAQLGQMCQGAARGSADDYARVVSAELRDWGKLIRGANIKPE